MLVTMLIVDLVLGLIGKTMPQMNVMSAGLTLRAVVGMLIVIVGLSLTSNVIRDAVSNAMWQAQAGWVTEGFVKLVTDNKGRLLGATIVGDQASELIVPWCLALKKGMAVQDMADLVAPYPSLSQTSGRAAVSFHAPLAAKPGIRRLIGFLRRFG